MESSRLGDHERPGSGICRGRMWPSQAGCMASLGRYRGREKKDHIQIGVPGGHKEAFEEGWKPPCAWKIDGEDGETLDDKETSKGMITRCCTCREMMRLEGAHVHFMHGMPTRDKQMCRYASKSIWSFRRYHCAMFVVCGRSKCCDAMVGLRK